MPLSVGSDYSWIIGVLLAAGASIVSNLGLNFQKLAHNRAAARDPGKPANYLKDKLWIFGLSLVILGSFADFAALAFAAQSIVAPLGSFTLVANIYFAPMMNGEEISRRDYASTFLIVIGAFLAVTFASHEDHIYEVEELFHLYTYPSFIVYATFVVVVLVALWLAIRYFVKLQQEGEVSGVAQSLYLQYRGMHRFAYPAASGVVGAQSVLFAKCFVELIMNAIFGGKGATLFLYPQSYLVICGMACTITLQLKWLNDGLQHFDALYTVPVFQAFWIIVSIISGLVFFGEYSSMSSIQMFGFPVGVLITIIGLYWLSMRKVVDVLAQPPHSAISMTAASTSSISPSPSTGALSPLAQSPRPSRSGSTSSTSGQYSHLLRRSSTGPSAASQPGPEQATSPTLSGISQPDSSMDVAPPISLLSQNINAAISSSSPSSSSSVDVGDQHRLSYVEEKSSFIAAGSDGVGSEGVMVDVRSGSSRDIVSAAAAIPTQLAAGIMGGVRALAGSLNVNSAARDGYDPVHTLSPPLSPHAAASSSATPA